MVTASERERKRKEEGAHIRRVLAGLGRTPDAVIDVGVRHGTPWLYDTFEDAHFILVDPQRGGEDLLTSRPRSCHFINKAVGRARGRSVLNEQGAMSTFLERTALTQVPTKKRYEVEVITLDDVIGTIPWARKIGLKIDIEGYELEAIAGLDDHADRIDFIISEASVLDRFENSYNFSELVAALWEKGFRFYNLLDIAHHPAPRVYDCIFLRKDDAAFAARDRIKARSHD